MGAQIQLTQNESSERLCDWSNTEETCLSLSQHIPSYATLNNHFCCGLTGPDAAETAVDLTTCAALAESSFMLKLVYMSGAQWRVNSVGPLTS